MFFDKILTKIFGTANERLMKKLWPVVAQINALEDSTKVLSDEQLRARTVEFRARIAAKVQGITDKDELKAAERAAHPEGAAFATTLACDAPRAFQSRCDGTT